MRVRITMEEVVILVISIIGLISVHKSIKRLMKWVWCMFLRPPKTLTTYGSWALITGCTAGIGKAVAFNLASQGLNLILVARNPKKLKATSDEIWEKPHNRNIKIKTITVDLGNGEEEEILGLIRREIKGLDVGVLVNNAGAAAKDPRYFHENTKEDCDTILKVNLWGVTWVTKAVLPTMLKRKKGFILNIGSGSSVILPSFPFSAIYAATKAYVAMFSRSLHVEYKDEGIDIQCQVPLYVATKMVSYDRASLFVPSPEEFSKWSLRWIGHDESLCIPYPAHALQAYLTTLMPHSLLNRLVYLSKLRTRSKILHRARRRNESIN